MRLTTPSLFIIGFLIIFTLGGLTGVMVAMVPFDWQVHDSYFVVAHFHYVLVGGMVFPLFAGFYYWAPAFSLRPLSERLGKWTFWLMFVGFNIAFLPMHLTGLLGMPRRVYTYPANVGWDGLNLLSSAGAFLLGLGVLVFLIDLVCNLRPSLKESAGNVWQAGTLDWLNNELYSVRSVPTITSRDPIWEQPGLEEAVTAGRWYLPGTATGWRETIITSAVDAAPQYLQRLPGPGWSPFLAAVFMAAFFMFLTVKLVMIALITGFLCIMMIIIWMWGSDPEPGEPVDIGGGIMLPAYVSGSLSHSWWAMVVLLLVAASLYLAYVFSYLYLWTVSPAIWPDSSSLPSATWPLAAAALLLASSGLLIIAGRTLSRASILFAVILLTALAALIGALTFDMIGHWRTGLRPTNNGHTAMVSLGLFLQTQLAVALLVMSGYVLVRHLTGRLDAVRRVNFDNLALLWHYAVAQSLLGLALMHGFPRGIG